jgi:GT2 family glycosyltransferase
MRVSVVVPVRNDAAGLRACLTALRAEAPFEVVVVDDASADDTAAVAEAAGVRVVRSVSATPSGAGAARNRGAREARGDVLFFVDADVVVAPGAVARVARTLTARPELSALFGSYDARPTAPGVVSQYRNLLHHWVHQQGNPDAFTFWAGCGAIRRAVFQAMGGFVERGDAATLEDVELGYRLRAAGHRVLLDKGLLCTHLKRWTLATMLHADVWYRAFPWGHLLLTRGAPDASLSLQRGQRPSLALVALALALLPVAVVAPAALAGVVAALAGVAVLNRRFYAFLRRERGLAFALAAFPLHILYFACGGVGLVWAWLKLRLSAPRDERVYVE